MVTRVLKDLPAKRAGFRARQVILGVLLAPIIAMLAPSVALAKSDHYDGITCGLSLNEFQKRVRPTDIVEPYYEGYNAGLTFDLGAAGIFSVLLDLRYSQTGNVIKSDIEDNLSTKIGEAEVTTALRAVEFQCLPKWKISVLPVKPYLALGPRMSIPLIGSRNEREILFGITVLDTTQDISGSLSFANFAMNGGIGLDVNLPGVVLFVQSGYVLGLTNLFRSSSSAEKCKGVYLETGLRVKRH